MNNLIRRVLRELYKECLLPFFKIFFNSELCNNIYLVAHVLIKLVSLNIAATCLYMHINFFQLRLVSVEGKNTHTHTQKVLNALHKNVSRELITFC